MSWVTPIVWTAKAIRYKVTRADLQTISDDLNALASGWIDDPNAWTYLGVGQYVVGAEYEDLTATYPVGAKLSCTDAAATKYFSVIACAVDPATHKTTITVTGGSDYTLSGGAITNPRYSYAATPYGFPGRFAYTPTPTGWNGPTLEDFWFSIDGSRCILSGSISGTSNATSASLTLPVTAAATRVTRCAAYGVDNGTPVVSAASILAGGTSVAFSKADSSTGWTNSGTKKVQFQISYPI